MNVWSSILVNFYIWWYGRLNLKGAGFLLSLAARFVPGLQKFPLTVPSLGAIDVDFRDVSAFEWQNYLIGKKCQEQGLLIAMSQYCKPNGVLWDIGANIGIISAYFANPDHTLKAIHAFEPNPEMFTKFKALFASNNIIHGHNIALSSENGQKLLHVPIGYSCKGSLVQVHKQQKTATFSVECYTGDELVESQNVPPPTVVKIDVEGHEEDVLKGMKNILKKYKPVVFLENLFLEVNNLPVLKDYSIVTVSSDDGTVQAGYVPDYGHNIALIPKGFVCGD
jgi:FkbM family methyltransferase